MSDSEVYEVLTKDLTTTYKNKLLKILRGWKKEGSISDTLYYRTYLTQKRSPSFMGHPRIST